MAKKRKTQRPIIRRKRAKTQPRGTTRRVKSKAVTRRRVKRKPITKPSVRSKRILRPKRRRLSIPRRGVSSAFRKFIRNPVAGKRAPSYVFVELQFVYGKKKTVFLVPISLGEMTPSQMKKIGEKEVLDLIEQIPGLQRAEFVAIRGYAQRNNRKGIRFAKKGRRRIGTKRIRNKAKTRRRS